MKNILHVDDDDEILCLVKELIRSLNFTGVIHSYNDPEEALKIIKDQDTEWDLLITDYDMPQMNGMDFARGAKKLSNAPIILFSGSNIVFDNACKEVFDFSISKCNLQLFHQELTKLLA